MTPDAAWLNDAFRSYLAIVLGLLAMAGSVLSVLTWGLKKNVQSIWATYRSWLVIVPVVVGCLLLGRAATILLVAALSIASFTEFARATGLAADRWLMTAV